MEEQRRRTEERHRKLLVEGSEAWFRARRLRRFIRACEGVLREGQALSADGWEVRWLAWAREHADRLDPMTNGFLEGNGSGRKP